MGTEIDARGPRKIFEGVLLSWDLRTRNQSRKNADRGTA